MPSSSIGGGAGAVDGPALEEQSDHAATEDFGHVLEVSEGDMAETSLLVEATLEDDSVDMGIQLSADASCKLDSREGRPLCSLHSLAVGIVVAAPSVSPPW